MSSIIAPILTVSFVVLLLGSVYRLYRIIRTPVNRHIPITPAPSTRIGVAAALLFESFSFRTLMRASVWTWVFGWLFHACLLLTIIIHARFFQIPAPIVAARLMPYSDFISTGLMVGLIGLLARRLLVARVRYVSALSDYLHLLLLIVITSAGIALATKDGVNVYEVTVFVQGLVRGDWQTLTPSLLLGIHILGVCVLMCLYPFSKLFHGPLMWFNPTRSSTRKVTRNSNRGARS